MHQHNGVSCVDDSRVLTGIVCTLHDSDSGKIFREPVFQTITYIIILSDNIFDRLFITPTEQVDHSKHLMVNATHLKAYRTIAA